MENTIDWELYENTPYEYDKIKMLKAWAEKGDADAQCKLGDKYYYGVGVAVNFCEAFRCYSLAAEQGNMLAQFYLGVMFEHGWGVKQNYKEAFNWYMKSALQGDEMSQNNLGHLYDYGLGLPVDYNEAMRWFRMAAGKGDPGAQYNIGRMYYWGRGVSADYSEARKWFLLSAKQGHHESQYSLGIMYGREGNDEESRYWHQLAAEQGHIYAISRYGQMLLCGYGGYKDEKKATSLLTEAASCGDSEAQLLLGVVYETGTCGKTRNIRLSKKWYKLAAKNGDERASKPLKKYQATRHRRRDPHERRKRR